ncbi:hypothetical protein ACQEPB_00340 [Novosphingobium fluoreni]|uniref:hypothetical protein n=1 Tax=Novosphingobium fluoreni TaxID=1391222 RepID=UPI003DA0220E
MTDWIALSCLMIGYVAILAAATLAVQPIRRKLVVLVDDMLEEGGWNKEERSQLEFYADSCVSSSAGMLMVFALAYSLASSILGDDSDDRSKMPRLSRDNRHHKLAALYLASIGGGSPFAALVATPMILMLFAIRALRGDRSLVDSIDAPIRRMSTSLHA